MSIRICHLSDTQIRNFKRHAEFRASYQNLYKSLREEKPDIIVLVGDIAHTKTQISPEFVDMCVDYFRNLAEIAPVVVVPGNHDGNLNNFTRMDALSPLVKALHHPSIYYYKHSGVYPFSSSVNFVVFSCFDNNWPTEIPKDGLNIGLYHGFVQGAQLQNGVIVDDCPYKLEEFLDKVDYLMLGDIHKMQILDTERRAAYCGSYPQQNYGESIEKGYLLWNIESKKSHTVDFIKLPNICPFYTVTLLDSLELSSNLDIQQGGRIRVFCRQLTLFEKKALTDRINSLYCPQDLIFMDDSNLHRQDIKLYASNNKLEDLEDINVQEKLIKEFLAPCNLSSASIDQVLEINKMFNLRAREKDDTFRNIQYKLGKMLFYNTFSYGENNEFDFSKYSGIVGIFGKNAVGKSSLAVDIPLYTMFNRISKDGVVKNDLIINEDKESCGSVIEIMVGRDTHVIARATHVYAKSGKREGDPIFQGKTEVAYKIIKEDGTEEDHTAEKRQDTDQVIRSKFGTIEDFVSTSMAPQWQLLGIINAGGTERLKLIGRYFDIDIFAQKHKMANDEWKGIKGQIRLYEKRNFDEEYSLANAKILEEQSLTNQCQEKKNGLDKEIERLEEKISYLRSSMILVPVLDNSSEEDFQDKIRNQEIQIVLLEKKLADFRERTAKKNAIDIQFLQNQKDLWKRVRTHRDAAKTLEKGCACKHEETCSLHQKIQELLKEAFTIESSIQLTWKEIKSKTEEWESIVVQGTEVGHLKAIEYAKKDLFFLQSQLQNFITHKDNIAKNAKITEEMIALNIEKTKLIKERSALENSLLKHASVLGTVSAQIEEINKSCKEYETIKRNYDVYYYFLSAMSKEGIAKQIIAENLNIINSEIKKILSKGVGFSVELESIDDGKAIEIYFQHESSKRRRIELCSGMEKTIVAIALRAALINVTTLPRSNVFVLDEVFTALDPEYMEAVAKILEYLKQLFDSVIIITHIDAFKDLVDHVVEIERDDKGFSKICE